MGKTLQIKKLEGVIYGLVRELEQLTPHPDRPLPFNVVSISRKSGSISKNFNHNASLMDDYLVDLPRRMGLERRLMACKRRLARLQDDPFAESFAQGFALAA